MRDYIRRFLIALIMGLFVTLLFLGGKQFDTGEKSIKHNNVKIDVAYHLPITSQKIYF
jgi:hypothetical protein